MTKRVLRADAILDVAPGLVLLAATWGGLFDALDLPHPEPELFTQVAGGLLLAFGYLLPLVAIGALVWFAVVWIRRRRAVA